MVKDILIDEYDYALPEDRIALHPEEPRDACRLLMVRPDGIISHRRFKELAGLLPPATMMVCNDTRVINARLIFHKNTGARIEIFLLEPAEPADYALMFQSRGRCRWHALAGNLKKWKEGELTLQLPDLTLKARKTEDAGEGADIIVEFSWEPAELPFAEVIEKAGNIPIPPYLNRDAESADLHDYQTVYAEREGSVAAPTAGLHFTPSIMADLDAHNIPVGKLTLHVGAGTFKPVKSTNIGDHEMHTETFTVSRNLLDSLITAKEKGKKIAAVGTTTVRTLESLPLLGIRALRGEPTERITQWEAYNEEIREFDTLTALKGLRDRMQADGSESLTAATAIMIAPGFRWRITDIMITNFHQPRSTLLLLVSSFLGDEKWREVYDSALKEDYRFLSYGDACLFMGNGHKR